MGTIKKRIDMIIQEDYVSFETAKLLKEKGFNEYCWSWYEDENYIVESNDDYGYQSNTDHITSDFICSRPTLQMAMKWLREMHYIHIAALCPIVDVDTDAFGVKYNVVISNLKNHCLAFDTDIEDNEYDTYEQASEAAIKYCLENLI